MKRTPDSEESPHNHNTHVELTEISAVAAEKSAQSEQIHVQIHGPCWDGVTNQIQNHGPARDGMINHNTQHHGPFREGVTNSSQIHGPFRDGVTQLNHPTAPFGMSWGI